jgi:hypothetical protein
VFTVPNSGLNAIDSVLASDLHEVLIYTSEAKEKGDAEYLDHKEKE